MNKAAMIDGETLLQCFEGCRNNNPGALNAIGAMLFHTELLVSTKEHKLLAVARGMGGMEVERKIARIPIGPIVEPNERKATGSLIRGKSIVSVEQFERDYLQIVDAIKFFKVLTLDLLIQDVRPKVGTSWTTLEPLTNPPDKSVEQDVRKYIHKKFKKIPGPTTIRLENGFDRPRLVYDKAKRGVATIFPYSPVVVGEYLDYQSNPLLTLEQIDQYLTLTRLVPGNERLQKHLHAAGGVLNEYLLLQAILSGIGVEVTLLSEIVSRTEDIPVDDLLRAVYPQAMIEQLDTLVGNRDSGGRKEEWLRNLAIVALMTRDLATGGSWDAIRALYGQVDAGESLSRDSVGITDLKPTLHVFL